ncbi:MAG TPA: phosphatase PAP2 family protein [Allosphingosinicella sp.]|jgi:undecaprenyl-diphosphatase
MRAPILALILLLLAAACTAALLLGGPEAPADASLLLVAQQGALVPAARLLTKLGDFWLVLVAGGVGTAWLALRGERGNALLLLALLVSQRLLVEQLKLVFDRARPDPAGHLIAVKTMAFPSGHASSAIVLGLALALLLPLRPAARRIAIAAALAYAFVIGATRLVLGVHWPSDIVGGWTLGALWTLLLVRLLAGTSPLRPH